MVLTPFDPPAARRSSETYQPHSRLTRREPHDKNAASMPISRRDLLKSSLSVPAAVAAAETAFVEPAEPQPPGPRARHGPARAPAARFRLALPPRPRHRRRQRFRFPRQFLQDRQFRSRSLPCTSTTAIGKPVDLPHDWAIELPFQNDPALASKGFYPLGRNYPATSIGWYRRVFELPEADAGKRITIEFDGSYREAIVVFNGFYIGRHIGGYDPFTFDVTAFANPGGKNVLLVRVDAT